MPTFGINPATIAAGTLDPTTFNRLVSGGFVFYNGIFLEIITVQLIKEVEYQGPDFLWNKFTLKVRGVYNPQATAYTLAAGGIAGGGRPFTPQVFKNPATVGGVTEVALRQYLAEPRRSLYYVTGASAGMPFAGVVVLASPDPFQFGATVDANNGPLPVVHSVTQVHGTKTMVVDWEVSTCLNETTGFNTPFPSPLVSNRYMMSHDLDEDYFAVRQVEGIAIFRTDIMAILGARPDDFRDWIVPPVPVGFKRDDIQVEQNADGTAVHYMVVDKEQQSSIVASGGVTRIEGIMTTGFTRETLEQAGMKVLSNIPQTGIAMAEGAVGGGALGGAFGPVGAAVGATMGAVVSGIAANTDAATSAISRQFITFDLEVWGNVNSTRDTLTAVATTIFLNKVSAWTSTYATRTLTLAHDIRRRHVKAHAELYLGLLGSGAIGAVQASKQGFDQFNGTFGSMDIPGVIQTAPAANPAPIQGSSRGGYSAALVYAALQPDWTPGLPGAYPKQMTLPEPAFVNRTLP